MNDDAKAWGDFWASNSGGNASGCLPERWAAIEDAQKRAWHSFLGDLDEGAAILDLATGDGRVLRWMREARNDLELSGIDLASELPPAPEGTTTRGGVAMEDLPFDDASFDAVVSQFGFEYGETSKVAAEIARVLTPGGRVGLMVHRGDGPILEHNLARRAAIEWAVNEQNSIEITINALSAPNGGTDVAAQVAAALALLGAQKFGQQTPAWEIPEAIRRTILLGTDKGTENVTETIKAIEAQARNEIGRIASLERACTTADDRSQIERAFATHGLTLKNTVSVKEPGGRVLADFITLV